MTSWIDTGFACKDIWSQNEEQAAFVSFKITDEKQNKNKTKLKNEEHSLLFLILRTPEWHKIALITFFKIKFCPNPTTFGSVTCLNRNVISFWLTKGFFSLRFQLWNLARPSFQLPSDSIFNPSWNFRSDRSKVLWKTAENQEEEAVDAAVLAI